MLFNNENPQIIYKNLETQGQRKFTDTFIALLTIQETRNLTRQK